MSGSTARALTLLELLEAHGRMGGAALAERLEVDMRTIRRYVMTLRDRGVPVEMERGRYGGYYLAAGYRRPLALTEREALSTAWGLLSIGRRSGGLAPGGDSERALAKLTQSLSQTTRSMIRDLEQVVTFADSPIPDGEPTDIGVEHLKTILFAVASRRRAQMVYRAWSGELTDRVVSPYHIVCRAGRWYVVGYCHLRRDQRVFRLDHIQSVAVLADTFDPPEIDALAAVEQAIGQVPWRWEYRIRLDLSLDEAAQRIPRTIASVTREADSVIMRGYADDLAPLAHLLAGLRCRLVVLSPPELRAALLALAEHTYSIAAEPDL